MHVEGGHARLMARGLAVAIAVFAVAHLVSRAVVRVRGHDDISTLELVDMDAELSIPTWYSVVVALVCAAVLALVAHRQGGARWWVLSASFAYLSMDEATMLHDRVSSFFARRFDGPAFVRPWLYFALAAVAAVAWYSWPVLRAVSSSARKLLLAGVVCFAVAAVLEFAGGQICEDANCSSWPYEAEVAAEESAEMAALSMFLLAAVHIAREHGASLTFAPVDRGSPIRRDWNREGVAPTAQHRAR